MPARFPSRPGTRDLSVERWEARIAGHAVALSADDPRLARELRIWVDHFAPGAGGDPREPFRFDFRSVNREALPPGAPPGRELVEYFYVQGRMAGDRPVFFGEDGSRLDIEPATRHAEAQVPTDVLDGPPWVLRDLFSAGLTWLLRHAGRFAVHAAAVRHDREGLVIVGPPMSGKTTLALNLVRRGWHWVSDDKVLIELASGAPLVTGLFRQSNVDPGLAAFFPELTGLADRAPAHPHSPKRVIHVGDEYPAGTAPDLSPTRLLFPMVVDAGPTTVEPMTPVAALEALLRQSPVLNDAATARVQMASLAAVTGRCTAWRLRTGRDLLADPDRLTAIGRMIGIDIGPPLPARHSLPS